MLPTSTWPGDEDVKRAFRVFDSEGLGFIKVTLLKRFLVQAQLGVEDAVCEYYVTQHFLMTTWYFPTVEHLIREHCHIDGDDLINYEGMVPCQPKQFITLASPDFITSIRHYHSSTM
jgi:hypothetical protein